jgi:hypothetical protein
MFVSGSSHEYQSMLAQNCLDNKSIQQEGSMPLIAEEPGISYCLA